MMNAKQSVFHGSTPSHSAFILSSHYHQQAGMNPHITAIHPNIPRNIAPKPNNQMPVTVSIANMAVSPPPSLQMSPPLHPHLSIQQHQPLTMQQPIGNQLPMQVQSALHSPTMQQVSLSSFFDLFVDQCDSSFIICDLPVLLWNHTPHCVTAAASYGSSDPMTWHKFHHVLILWVSSMTKAQKCSVTYDPSLPQAFGHFTIMLAALKHQCPNARIHIHINCLCNSYKLRANSCIA